MSNLILEDIREWAMEKRIKVLSEKFFEKTGNVLNLNNPKSFSEMLQWIKLFYHDPDMSRCVDKVAFKDYIREKIGSEVNLAKVYQVWEKPEDVDLRSIPNRCIIKSNCSSDGNNILIVPNKDELDIKKEEWMIKESWFDRLGLHTNSFASYYYDVVPKVFVEEYLSDIGGADDYDVFCFHGEPRFFWAKTDHFDNTRNLWGYPISFYTLDWKFIDVKCRENPNKDNLVTPEHINEMIEISEKLATSFPFVRVDFFDTKDKLYLAEVSFAPYGGMVPYEPQSFDDKMGEWLDILHTADMQYVDSYWKDRH